MEYVYVVLLLHKAGKEINEENIKKVIESAGIAVDESKIKSLVASLKGVDITKTLEEAASMPVASGTAAGAAEGKKEEKKEDKHHEEAAEGLSALFG